MGRRWCYLDLEGVAEINTAYGREVGDAYIQNFVEIVRKNFRPGALWHRRPGGAVQAAHPRGAAGGAEEGAGLRRPGEIG